MRSSVHNSSRGSPLLASFATTSITMTNSIEPLIHTTFTSKLLLSPRPVLASRHRTCLTVRHHCMPSTVTQPHSISSRPISSLLFAPCQMPFPSLHNASIFFLARCFSCVCCTTKMTSVVPIPGVIKTKRHLVNPHLLSH